MTFLGQETATEIFSGPGAPPVIELKQFSETSYRAISKNWPIGRPHIRRAFEFMCFDFWLAHKHFENKRCV